MGSARPVLLKGHTDLDQDGFGDFTFVWTDAEMKLNNANAIAPASLSDQSIKCDNFGNCLFL